MISSCTIDVFTRDVAKHELTVLRDEGLYRHLRFRKPGTSCMGFDLLTWPGHLCYTGDMGTYVFQRLDDMLQFFRQGERRSIDFRYWAEKVEAADKCDGIKEFKWATFEADVKDFFDSHWAGEDLRYEETQEEFDARKAACWEEVQSSIGDAGEDEYAAVAFIRDFEHEGFRFQDWERSSHEYTFRFVWCCYALAWGIRQYDAFAPVLPALEAA